MEITTTRLDDGPAVLVSGEMDADTAYDVYLEVVAQAESVGGAVTLDLSDVSFLDSVGLSMLLRARDELANQQGARLVLRRPSKAVSRILQMTALQSHFEITT